MFVSEDHVVVGR